MCVSVCVCVQKFNLILYPIKYKIRLMSLYKTHEEMGRDTMYFLHFSLHYIYPTSNSLPRSGKGGEA